MCELVINGGKRLFGEVTVQGSKNAALPILAATLLTDGECVLHNCPDISDCRAAFDILGELGGCVSCNDRTVTVCVPNIRSCVIPKSLMQRMRSSVMFLGAILARCGEAVICRPGGCRIGERPIDIHIRSLADLGAEIIEDNDCIYCRLDKVRPKDVTLLYPSVGATENIMLMCAVSDGEARVFNAAREPEIVNLQNFLNLMGADICGAGSDVIRIRGVTGLHGCECSVMPDRIAAATYACAAAVCGGDVLLRGAEAAHLRLTLEALRLAGCEIFEAQGEVRIKSSGRLHAIDTIKTLPYPGFPTDAQPILSAALAMADGTSRVCETIFENRFSCVPELRRMGADISERKNTIEIRGVKTLHGAEVTAMDLRGGAALAVAGLAANGTTVIGGVDYIDRGYESIERDLSQLGADITRLEQTT